MRENLCYLVYSTVLCNRKNPLKSKKPAAMTENGPEIMPNISIEGGPWQ
jgi:hypothetical protein